MRNNFIQVRPELWNEDIGVLTQRCNYSLDSSVLAEMNCPKCSIDLQTQSDRGVEVEACPSCQGMWLTPAELDQLENEAFSNEANKGSLYIVSQATELKCPVCSTGLRQFDYRFFDLQIDCCPEHGFWLDKDKANQILELLRGEEKRIERKFGTEDSGAKYIISFALAFVFHKGQRLIPPLRFTPLPRLASFVQSAGFRRGPPPA
jgi:Zn-finger nucleic acid-binding protein